MGITYEIQFRGYDPYVIALPVNDETNPFENVDEFDANPYAHPNCIRSASPIVEMAA